jgi:hypothetical protein
VFAFFSASNWPLMHHRGRGPGSLSPGARWTQWTFLAKAPHLEAMLEVGETIPAPTSDVDFVELETVA